MWIVVLVHHVACDCLLQMFSPVQLFFPGRRGRGGFRHGLNIKCAILRSVVENDLVSLFAKVLSVNLLLGIIITIVKMNLSWYIMLAFFFLISELRSHCGQLNLCLLSCMCVYGQFLFLVQALQKFEPPPPKA